MKVIITFVVLVVILTTLSFKLGYQSAKKGLIEVRKSNIHHKGVFANYPIKKNQIVEIAPYIVVNDKTPIINYVFYFQEQKVYCLVFGYGSVYNHSNNPNVRFNVRDDNQNFEYIANRDIQKGEELFIDYGAEYWTSRKIKPI